MRDAAYDADPIKQAKASLDKAVLYSGFRFKMSRIESTGDVLIENEPGFADAIFMGLFGLFLASCFLLPWESETKRCVSPERHYPEPLFFQLIAIVLVGTLLVGSVCLIVISLTGSVLALFPRRILIQDDSLRFQGVPFSSLVVPLERVEGVYAVTNRHKYGTSCRVAFAIRTGRRVCLLYANTYDVFYNQGIREEKDQILAYTALVKLLKEIVQKPAMLQRYAQKSPKRLRPFWR